MLLKRLTDGKEVEIAGYIKQYLEESGRDDIQIYVGCDSQNKADVSIYATTVVLHIGDTGCHVLYLRERLPRIDVMWDRLWKEVERSVALALYLREHGVEIHNIDLDLNEDDRYASSRLVSAARGWVESLGINANIKPDLLPAVHAADNINK
jgi:predicted RNase H-related nuclease YkuK (DUF458 family)